MDQSTINVTGMEYGGRHGDVNIVGGQLPMTLSKFQSNVSASKVSSTLATTDNHQMILEKKKVFEGQDHIVGQQQLLNVKPSLPATATTSASATGSSSSVKKFFGRNKGGDVIWCLNYCTMY